MIQYTCPACGTSFEFRKRVTANRRGCPHCNHEITPAEIDRQAFEAKQHEYLQTVVAAAKFQIFVCGNCGVMWPLRELLKWPNRACPRCRFQTDSTQVRKCDERQSEISIAIIGAYLRDGATINKQQILEKVGTEMGKMSSSIAENYNQELRRLDREKQRQQDEHQARELMQRLSAIAAVGGLVVSAVIWWNGGGFGVAAVVFFVWLFVCVSISSTNQHPKT